MVEEDEQLYSNPCQRSLASDGPLWYLRIAWVQ